MSKNLLDVKNPKDQKLHRTVRKMITSELSQTPEVTLNSLQSVCQARSYLESPSLLSFDRVKNERIHPSVEVEEIKENSSESNNCKGNEFQNPEEDTSLRPPYLGGREEKKKKKHHIRGAIQLAFLPSVGKGAPGRNQKFCPIKEVFKDVMLPPPLSVLLHYSLPLLTSLPLTNASICNFCRRKINK